MSTPLPWKFDDGGRAVAGYKGQTSDCVCRAIAIATGSAYSEVYYHLNVLGKVEVHKEGRPGKRSSARTGVRKSTYRAWLRELGWSWTPTMGIGTGCRVHLAMDELPMNEPLIVEVSKHIVAVINGIVHDTHDPTREGTRCVYGYWQKVTP